MVASSPDFASRSVDPKIEEQIDDGTKDDEEASFAYPWPHFLLDSLDEDTRLIDIITWKYDVWMLGSSRKIGRNGENDAEAHRYL